MSAAVPFSFREMSPTVALHANENSNCRGPFTPRKSVTIGNRGEIDTVEVCGSSPHGPTILLNELQVFFFLCQPEIQPEIAGCPKLFYASLGF